MPSHVLLSRLCLVLLVSNVWHARGQTPTGSISGVVLDPSGAVIQQAPVSVTGIHNGSVRETLTSSTGAFKVPLLEPGEYMVRVRFPGFRDSMRGPVKVRTTETVNLEISMQIGTVQDEPLIVEADASLLQTAEPTLGHVFTARQLTDLPLVSRNYTQLLSLQGGVVADLPNAAAFGHGSEGLSVSGSRYYDNSVFIDGLNAVGSITNGYVGIGPGPMGGVAVPAPDAVQEFKVQTNMYSAEFGRSGGASVHLVTRSGSNSLHGGVYEFFRNEALNANEFFYKRSQIANGQPNQRPILRENRFGGTIGGPLKKDRTFVFGAFQGTRQLNGAAPGLIVSMPRYPLLPVDRGSEAELRRELGAIFGGRGGFPAGSTLEDGTLINTMAPNGSNISSTAIRMLQVRRADGSYLFPSFPVSRATDNLGGRNGGQVFSSAAFSFPSRFDENQLNLNLDHVVTSRNTVAFRLFTAPQDRTLPGGNLPGFTQISSPANHNAGLAYTATFSPTVVNELRGGLVRITNPTKTTDAIRAADVVMKPAVGSDRLPQIAIAGSGILLNAAQGSSRDVENMFTLSDAMSIIVGSHSLRAGGSYIRHQLYTDSDLLKAGQIIMIGFEDFLLGASGAENRIGLSNLLATAAQTGSFEKAYRFNDVSFFLQDDWRIRRNLTVNFGLRYDYFAWPIEKYGRIGNFDPSLVEEGPFGIPAPGGSVSGFVVAGNLAAPVPPGVTVGTNSTIEPDKDNFGPRLGMAWQPAARWSLRGGYGIFYPRVNAEFANAMAFGFPFNSLLQASFTPNGSLQDPFTHLNLPPDASFPQWAPRVYNPTATASAIISPIDRRARNPYVQQWNFSIQRELTRDLVIEAAYLGSHGLRLINNRAGNTPELASASQPLRGVTTNTAVATNLQARSPVAGIVADRGVALTTTDAESKYHAGVLTLNKRFSRGLQFLSALTVGKSIDNNTLTPTGSVSNAQTPGDNRHLQHYGLSTFDRKHRWVTSFTYELPSPARGAGIAATILGGWQTAGVLVLQSGQPLTLTTQPTGSLVKLQGFLTPEMQAGKTLDDIRGEGPVSERIESYFGSPRLGQPGSVFAAPAPTSFGGLGRGLSLRSPGQKSFDVSLSKNARLGESLVVQVRGEFYNALNWVNFGSPATNVSLSTFGTIASTTTAPRVVQLAVKLLF